MENDRKDFANAIEFILFVNSLLETGETVDYAFEQACVKVSHGTCLGMMALAFELDLNVDEKSTILSALKIHRSPKAVCENAIKLIKDTMKLCC